MANETNDPSQVIANLYEAGQAVLRQMAAMPGAGAPAGGDDPMAQFVAATQQLAGLQRELVKQMSAYWTGAPWLTLEAPAEAAPRDDDKRFASEAWRTDPRFDFVRKSYAAYASFLQSAVESACASSSTRCLPRTSSSRTRKR
jgi:hypothetical protein